MTYQVKYNCNSFLVNELYNFAKENKITDPQKLIRLNTKITDALDGILSCIHAAKDCHQHPATTDVKHYSLNSKYSPLIQRLVKKLFGCDVREISTKSFCTAKFDHPTYKRCAVLCLSWLTNDSCLSNSKDDYSAFLPFREKRQFTDVTLVCEGKQFEAHKVVLAARSEFMKRMLLSEFAEKKLDTISIEAPSQYFEEFLDFIYTNCINIKGKPVAFIISILQLAQYFQVSDLIQACTNELRYQLESNNENLPKISAAADKLSIEELIAYCSWKSTECYSESPCKVYGEFVKGKVDLNNRSLADIQKILLYNQFVQNGQIHQDCLIELNNILCEENADQISALAKKFNLEIPNLIVRD